jgi:hypothetical protein
MDGTVIHVSPEPGWVVEPAEEETGGEPERMPSDFAVPYEDSAVEEVLERDASVVFLQSGGGDAVAVCCSNSGALPDEHLSPLQARALQHVADRVLAASQAGGQGNAHDWVLERLSQGGYGASPEMALYHIERFVEVEVPVVTWFKPFKSVGGRAVIDLMTEDVALRNLFETGHGNGNPRLEVRTEWERRMFGPAYDDCAPRQRAKYGLVNIFNDPEGPQVPGHQYGDCFLAFRGLRHRVSVTPKDSLGNECAVATLGVGLPALLREFRDEDGLLELKTLADLAMGKLPWAQSGGLFYKEAQLHGDVLLQDHVSHVVVPGRYRERPGRLRALLRFCDKNGCGLVFVPTLRWLADLRLHTVAEMRAAAARAGAVAAAAELDALAAAQPPRTTLLCGPQAASARAHFDALCAVRAAQDLREARRLAFEAAGDGAGEGEEGGSDGEPEVESPSGGLGDLVRLRKALREAVEGAEGREGCPQM